MSANITAKAQVTINAPAQKVWEALTTPALIKQYFFGTEAVSDWKVGSPIEFKGTWEGKAYSDKGEILRNEPPNLLQYSYYSSFSKLPDSPENYCNVTYELLEDNGSTTVLVKQENIDSMEARDQSETNWNSVLNSLKELMEK